MLLESYIPLATYKSPQQHWPDGQVSSEPYEPKRPHITQIVFCIDVTGVELNVQHL